MDLGQSKLQDSLLCSLYGGANYLVKKAIINEFSKSTRLGELSLSPFIRNLDYLLAPLNT